MSQIEPDYNDIFISDVESEDDRRMDERDFERKYISLTDDTERQRGEEREMAGDEADQDDELEIPEGISIIKKTVHGGRDPYKNKRFRWWFLTWNNPKHPEDKDVLLSSRILQYVKFQYEKGKTGTKHYQGVFYTKESETCTRLRKKFPGCGYLAPVKSTKGAVNYCGKTDSRIEGPWESGIMPEQGKRNDLLECKSIIDRGGGMGELFEHQFSNAVRYGRGLKEYVNLVNKDKVRKWQTTCYCYIGDAGMGKTQAASIEAAKWGGGTYWLTLEGGTFGKVWWDGYEGEENIIIDEFNCQIKLADFKRLIDSSPLKLPIKGGMVNFLGKRIWICSNKMLDAWYYKAAPPGTERNALLRRLHYREDFYDKFQGAPNYEDYIDMRELFVELQQKGEWVIKKN